MSVTHPTKQTIKQGMMLKALRKVPIEGINGPIAYVKRGEVCTVLDPGFSSMKLHDGKHEVYRLSTKTGSWVFPYRRGWYKNWLIV